MVAGCYALELVEGWVGEAEGVDCVFVSALIVCGRGRTLVSDFSGQAEER